MYIRLFCRFYLMYYSGWTINQKITKVYHASLFQRENIYAAAIFNLNTLIKPLNNSTPWWEWLKKLLDKKTSPIKYSGVVLEDPSVMWSVTLKVNEESEKVGLKLNIQKTKIMASSWSHHFMANRWGNSGNSVRLYFGGLQNHCRWWLQLWN